MKEDKKLIDVMTDILAEIHHLRTDFNHRFENMDKRFETMDKRFETMDKRFETMDRRLENLENHQKKNNLLLAQNTRSILALANQLEITNSKLGNNDLKVTVHEKRISKLEDSVYGTDPETRLILKEPKVTYGKKKNKS